MIRTFASLLSALTMLPPVVAHADDVLARRLERGPASVLVEYHHAALDSEFRSLRRELGLPREDAALITQKAERLAAVKETLLPQLPLAEVRLIRDYRHLPLSHLEVRSAGVLAFLRRHPAVRAVHPDRPHRLLLSGSLPLIRQPEVAQWGERGAGTAVMVTDTGVDYSRSAFGSCTAPGEPGCRVVAAFDTAVDDGAADAHGHGTNVAAIVAAVAPATDLIAVDVFDGQLAWTSDIVTAIDWAIAQRDTYDIVAINMSLGGDQCLRYDTAGECRDWGPYTAVCDGADADSGDLAAAIAGARAAGIVTLAAAGNGAYSNGLATPACTSDAVSVGAVYDQAYSSRLYGLCSDHNVAADDIACFSNSAAFLDLLAPGVGVTAGDITLSGTSQATPHAAGAIAVLAAAFPYETTAQWISRAKSFATPLTDGRNGVTSPRLDLSAAVGAGFQGLLCSGDAVELHKLSIPAGFTEHCEAASRITTGQAVAIGAGGTLTLRAPVVTLGPGFRAEAGSLVFVNP